MRGQRTGDFNYDPDEFGERILEFVDFKGWRYSDLALAVGEPATARGSINGAAHGRRKLPLKIRTTLIELMVRESAISGRSVDRDELYRVAGLADGAQVTTAESPSSETVEPHGFDRHLLKDTPAVLAKGAMPGLRDLLVKSFQLMETGRWDQAEQVGLSIRSRYRRGSVEWVAATIRHCAMMAQQRGDLALAAKYLNELRETIMETGTSEDPLVKALLLNIRAWIKAEQLGAYQRALAEFRESAELALVAGDESTRAGSLGWAFIVESQIAMSFADAWVSALPSHGSLPTAQITALEQSLATEWEEAYEHDPYNPSNLHRRFSALALLAPSRARIELGNIRRFGEETDTQHIAALSFARWHYSQEAWDEAAEEADLAMTGYRAVAHPAGIAFGALVKGGALLAKPRKSPEELRSALDSLVIAVLLQPYLDHPVRRAAAQRLLRVSEQLFKTNQRGLKGYLSQLDVRASAGDGELASLRDVFDVVPKRPSLYLPLILPESISALFWD